MSLNLFRLLAAAPVARTDEGLQATDKGAIGCSMLRLRVEDNSA